MNTSATSPMLCAHCGRPMLSSVQAGGRLYHYECTQSPYAHPPSYGRPASCGVVYVCPEKDIECGDRPKNWCVGCPKRSLK